MDATAKSIKWIAMEKALLILRRNWNKRRLFGLAIGVFVASQAIVYKDALLGVLSAFFLLQIATNTGCFGAGACSIQYPNSINDD